MGPGCCIIISPEAVPPELWDPDTASAQRLFLPSYGTRTLHHYQPRGCSSRVMGPRRCIIISPEAVSPELWNPDTASLIHYQPRSCSSRVMGPRHCISISPGAVPPELWDPDAASVSAQRLFLPSYGTRTLHQYQLRGCSSRVMGPGHCISISSEAVPPELWDPNAASLSAVPPELWDPDTASVSAQRLFLPSYGTRTLHHYQLRGFSSRVMGPGHCISPEAVHSELWDPDAASLSAQRLFLPSHGTRTLHHYQPRGCSSRVMGPRRCIIISPEAVPPPGHCIINSLSAQKLFLLSYGTQTLHQYRPRGCSS